MFFTRIAKSSLPPSFLQYLVVSMSNFENRMLRKTFIMPGSMPASVFFYSAFILIFTSP